MKITKSTIEKLALTEIKGLDPISVFLENFGPGQGKLTVECFGDAWSHYWGAMGDGDLTSFLASANVEYITGKLFPCEMDRSVIDYDKIAATIGEDSLDEGTLMLHEDKVIEAYGGDWHHLLPKKQSHHYEYLMRVVVAVKEAIVSLGAGDEVAA